MRNLAGKVAMVTGGAGGIGKAIAERLHADGATVVITDINHALGQASAGAAGYSFLQQDVCDERRWADIVREVEDRFGKLDILVNNAGIVGSLDSAGPETASLADWRHIFSVNVESVFLGCRAAIPALRRTGSGSIINMSSVAGLRATPQAAAYGASKAAVRQLTKTVAQHCAEENLNVRCNSVHPSDVRTPLSDQLAQQIANKRHITTTQVIEEWAADVPLGKMPLAEDVAAAVAFLASDDARHITGSEMIVDGGLVHCDSYHVRAGARSRADRQQASDGQPK